MRPNTPLFLLFFLLLTLLASAATPPVPPTFNKDILPIIENRCQTCHRPGEIGPMPLITYEQTKPWVKAIGEAVKSQKMPPWFADKCCGQFSTKSSLRPEEIALIEAWVTAGAPEGKKKDIRPLLRWTNNWRIDGPSVVVSLPRAFEIPANSKIDVQYVILPIDLPEDRWASAVEIHPSDRSVVDRAVVYIRPKESKWLRDVPPLTMYAPRPGSMSPNDLAGSEILAVYTPGSPTAVWPAGMGKKLPVHGDLVLQLHYTSKKIAAYDRTSVGINFLKEVPRQRVLTLQMENRDFAIPAGASDYRASVSAVMPRDASLINIIPLMHLRGTGFECDVVPPGGQPQTLLHVEEYDYVWRMSYPLKSPRMLPKGAKLVLTGSFDNSSRNPRNPDPKAEVHWGEQNWEEMLTGFFDVAVEPGVEKISLVSSPNN